MGVAKDKIWTSMIWFRCQNYHDRKKIRVGLFKTNKIIQGWCEIWKHKSQFSSIPFVYNLMTRCSVKKSRIVGENTWWVECIVLIKFYFRMNEDANTLPSPYTASFQLRRSMHFGDVSETSGRETPRQSRSVHAWAFLKSSKGQLK